MSLALWLWLRRSSTARALPALLVIEGLSLFSRGGWNHEWGWALSWATSGTALLAPVLAGLVAFDRGRRLEPTLALLASCAPRGGGGSVALMLASWVWATAALLAGMAVAAGMAWRGGAVGGVDLWLFVEGPVLLFLAACFGLAVGTHARGLLSAPAAAVAFYGLWLFAGSLGLHLEGLFSAGGSTGTLVGLRRTPASALALVLAHGALAAVALVAALIRIAPGRRTRAIAWLAVAGMLAGACLVNLSMVSSRVDVYERIAAPRACVSGAVTVCGPRDATYVLDAAQASLRASLLRLQGSGIGWQTHYVLARVNQVHSGEGVLRASPESMKDGRLSVGDIAGTLATPRLCRGLFPGTFERTILADQGVVMNWVSDELQSRSPVGPAPQRVRDAYARLRTCDPMTDPLP